jgi:hypothetical protein
MRDELVALLAVLPTDHHPRAIALAAAVQREEAARGQRTYTQGWDDCHATIFRTIRQLTTDTDQ